MFGLVKQTFIFVLKRESVIQAAKILSAIAILSTATGIFFSVVLFSLRKGNKLANRLLALLLFTFSVRIGEFALYWTDYITDMPHLVNISAPLPFLFGGLIFLYTKTLLNKEKLNRWEYLHFLPFVIYIIYMLPFYSLPVERKLFVINNILSDNPVINLKFYAARIIKITHMFIYLGLTFNLIRSNRGKWFQNDSMYKNVVIRWLRYLMYGFSIFIVVTVLHTTVIWLTGYEYITQIDSLIMLASALMIYTALYQTIKHPEIFWGEIKTKNKAKYEKSSLDSANADRYFTELKRIMDDEKLYLKNDLKLSDLSERLSIPSYHISQILSEKTEQNFFDFVNKYRVEKARQMLTDPLFENYKIVTIAYECGFNTKASFNSTFKKFTGITPSEYKKNKVIG